MKVTPAPAIHPLHIRQKPVTEQSKSPESPATFEPINETLKPPAPMTSAAFHGDAYRVTQAEYSVQLLTSNESYPKTPLELNLQLRQYQSSTSRKQKKSSNTTVETA